MMDGWMHVLMLPFYTWPVESKYIFLNKIFFEKLKYLKCFFFLYFYKKVILTQTEPKATRKVHQYNGMALFIYER